MAFQTFLAGALMALASLLALLTLLAGLRARRKGLASGLSLAPAILALLLCGGFLAALLAGWLNRAVSFTSLEFAVLLLTLVLGWAMLSWMADFRKTTAAVHQARDLELLVRDRNAELSARLQDLEEARRTAEVANKGLQRALEQLEQVASTDRLTGAWNRRRFEEAVPPRSPWLTAGATPWPCSCSIWTISSGSTTPSDMAPETWSWRAPPRRSTSICASRMPSSDGAGRSSW